MRLQSVVAALAAIAITASALPARAGEQEKQAQALFVDGMKLMAKKQYAEACDKLARSQELDPGMGTQYRLAECYEKLGRLASAFDQYTAVADAAKAAGKPDREAVARKRAAGLEPRVAKLTIVLPPSVAALSGLTVARDGKPVDAKLYGTPIPVDPGDHVVTVNAPGKKTFEGKVWAEASSKLTVAVALEDVTPPPEEPPPPKSIVPTIVLGAAGGLGVVLGATFAGLRAGQAGSAHALHDKIAAAGGNCVGGGGTMFAADCKALASATSKGDAFGTGSVVTFVVGGAALVGMTTYLLVPQAKPPRKTGLGVAPVVGPGQAGLAAWGAF
jgi:hypothetical protein